MPDKKARRAFIAWLGLATCGDGSERYILGSAVGGMEIESVSSQVKSSRCYSADAQLQP